MRTLHTGLAAILAIGCGGASSPDAGSTDAGVAPDAALDAGADAAVLPPPEASTEHGPVVGVRGDGYQAFLGIPYAAPPVGALRWRAPQPPEPWTEPRIVSRAPPRCVQGNLGVMLPGQEDCLYLSVHAPDPRPSGAPVLVWIHGGAFIFGEGLQADGGTAGDVLAARHGLVVVSMNYRLGAYGFLAHPALGAEDDASGNYGLADQIAALEWVRRNIAAFGGDASNVTIAGESAGGRSVCTHLVSDRTSDLFHAAVVQSGLCDATVETIAQGEAQGLALASALGCADGDVLSCLRSKTPDEIRAAEPSSGSSVIDWTAWGPHAGGAIVPGQFRARVEAGLFHSVPVIVGWNADEGTLFVLLGEMSGLIADEAQYLLATQQLADTYGVAVDDVRAQYPLASYPEPGAAIADVLGDAALACPSRRSARLLADHGAPVWVYHFEYPDADFLLGGTRDLGAFHSGEIQFVFGHPGRLGARRFTGDELALHDAMSGYWARFVGAHDPNGAGALAWPAYDSTTDRHLVLDRVIAQSTAADADVCLLWD